MAIKGYLSEITFIELLKIIGTQNGKLNIWNIKEKKQYECYFYDQAVIYLNFCGKPVSTEESVKDIFLELITDDRSYYAFQHEKFPEAERVPIVSVSELMDLSLFETPEDNDELLPHVQTRFETVNKVDFELQGALAGFWKDAIGLLHQGCSGYDICIQLGLEEKSVRRNLYKLRTTGLIKPVRMFNAAGSLAKSVKARPDLSRLAGKYQGAGQVQTATSAPQSVPAGAAVPLQPTMATAAHGASWQNAYVGGNYHEKPIAQPTVTIQTENLAPTVSAENIAPTEFARQTAGQSFSSGTSVSVDAVTETIYEHSGRALDEAPDAPAPFAGSEESVAPTVLPPANPTIDAVAASSATPTGREEKRAPAQNLISPVRAGLFKRMLNSLFKN